MEGVLNTDKYYFPLLIVVILRFGGMQPTTKVLLSWWYNAPALEPSVACFSLPYMIVNGLSSKENGVLLS